MGRKILAIVVAMITAVAIICLFYMFATMTAPNTPTSLLYLSSEEIADYMQTFPLAGFVAVAIGYALAAFAGGFISTKMGRRWSSGMTLALIVGVLLTAGAALVSLKWPQPTSFILISLLIFVPGSLMGYKFAHKAL